MATTYRITYLAGNIDTTSTPPAIVSAVFPAFDGSQLCSASPSEILVTFASPQTPADLGPLVKVELVSE
jgi:hypothetical protein